MSPKEFRASRRVAPRDSRAPQRCAPTGSATAAIGHGRQLQGELKIIAAILERPVIERIPFTPPTSGSAPGDEADGRPTHRPRHTDPAKRGGRDTQLVAFRAAATALWREPSALPIRGVALTLTSLCWALREGRLASPGSIPGGT